MWTLGRLLALGAGQAAALPGAFIPLCLLDPFAHPGFGQVEVPVDLGGGPVRALNSSTISALNSGVNERRRASSSHALHDRTSFGINP
jgi:hypothetical protein